MGESAHLDDRSHLRAHRAALHAFQVAATGACQESLGALERATVDVQRSIDRWAAKRAEAQRELTAAERAVRACRRIPKADCSGEVRACQEAQAWLAETEDNLATAKRCGEQLRAAADRFRRELSAYRRHLGHELVAAASFLGGLSVAADAYAGLSVGGGGGGGGAASAVGLGSAAGPGPGSVGGSLPTIGRTDLSEAPLDQIDTSDSGVSGPESFQKTSYATMREGTQRLDEVVLPAVKRGADGDYFARLDAERGLDYEHGYQRVYDAFFGSDSLRLDARADGRYGVTNGYHRIHVARKLGLRTLPARIFGRRS
ncbi:MAG TPA: hypothetical protein VG816_11480 [Solirubrobacterales bacterium]|nr:hypothetical protein [Solirubrobacterales bacterium]